VPEECHLDRADAKRMAKSGDRWQHFAGRMPSSSICRAARVLLGSAAYLCVGCGATGLDWVGEAQLESTQQQSVSAARISSSRAVVPGSIPATAEQDSSEPRPRLNHTVTLGEVDAVALQEPTAAGRSALPGPAVIVNNYNQVNLVTPGYGYGSFGYWRGSPGFSPGRVTGSPLSSHSSGPQAGQNWPAVADHGPSFPYASAPASPWTRTQ